MKDVETFLRAAALFHTERQDLQFVLCGDGFEATNKTLTDTIAGLGLQRDIVLLGRRNDMELVYPTLDILTLCSIYGEGFPNVLAEAMACGVPCVTTDVGDSAEIVGDSGLIVPTRDPQSLIGGWRSLLEGSVKGAGTLARARIAAHYGLRRMCADYESLYHSLAVSGSAVPA